MENPLEKLLGSVFKKDTNDGVVGVDIGSSSVKIVQLHKKGGKAVLKTYGAISLGPLAGLEVGQATNLSAEKLSEAINDLFKESAVTTRDVIFSLPLVSTWITVFSIPDLGEAKLKEMIPIEARKYIPTPISEVSMSHWVIPKIERTYIDPDEEEKEENAPPKADVLLAAVHNDVIAKYNDIAKRIDATNVSFEIEIFSTIRATIERNISTAMIIDIGAANTKIVILEEGVVRDSHLVNVGSQDITLALSRSRNISLLQAEEIKREFGLTGDPKDPSIAEITRLSFERVIGEANQILSRYQHEKRISISTIIMTGGGALMKGTLELAQKSFSSASVIHGNAFDKVEAPAVLEPLLKEAGPEFAVAIGLALRKL